MTATVLVVDDDPALQRVLRLALRALGYEVVAAMTGASGLSEAALHSPDVIVLDLGLPDLGGVEVCRRVREWSDVPIVVLSADGTEQSKVEALDLGADDYVTKPFSMSELQARLRVALRRRRAAETAGAPSVTVGPLELDLLAHEVRMGGRLVELTKREFQILSFLALHAGKVCTHKMLLDAVWGAGYGASGRYLREYVPAPAQAWRRGRRAPHEPSGHRLPARSAAGRRRRLRTWSWPASGREDDRRVARLGGELRCRVGEVHPLLRRVQLRHVGVPRRGRVRRLRVSDDALRDRPSWRERRRHHERRAVAYLAVVAR